MCQTFRKKSKNTITWYTKNGNAQTVIEHLKSHMVKRAFMIRRDGCYLTDVRNAGREEEDNLEAKSMIGVYAYER